jgi:uroporphyrinogen-III synthase
MADEMRSLIERYGGQALVAPSMREVPLENNTEALRFGFQLLAGQFDLLILLTGVGTRTLIDVLQTRHRLDEIKAALGRVTLVARGPKPIAALKELGLAAQISVPEPNTWRDILATLDRQKGRQLTGFRIAVQDYGVPNHEFLAGLRERGAEVTHVPVYRWTLPEDTGPLAQVMAKILRREIDVILITNAVQVDHVIQLIAQESGAADAAAHLRQAAANMVIASIGPTASERLRSYDLPVDLEPSHPKMGTLVKEASERAHALLSTKRPVG